MRKINSLIIFIVCILITGIFVFRIWINPGNSQGKQGIEWQEYDRGFAAARHRGEKIFLYFYADWCFYCGKLNRTTFQDDDVIEYLRNNFVSISVNFDVNPELAAQWRITGLPTLLFLAPDSTEIKKIPGYIGKDNFLKLLKYLNVPR